MKTTTILKQFLRVLPSFQVIMINLHSVSKFFEQTRLSLYVDLFEYDSIFVDYCHKIVLEVDKLSRRILVIRVELKCVLYSMRFLPHWN